MPLSEAIRPISSWLADKQARWEALSEEERQRIIKVEEEERNRLYRDEWAQGVKQRLAKMPRRYQHATTQHPDALEWCSRFLADEHCRGLLISGPTGVGKTHLLWGMYRFVSEKTSQPFIIVKLVSLLSQLRPAGGEDGATTIPRLVNVALLGIDDLGAQKSSEWVEERLYELIDSRYDAERPMIITTNRKPEKLDEVVGERLASRLLEACEVLLLTGPDRRRS